MNSETDSEDVRRLLNHYQSNDDVLWFLLRVVWQGQLTGALLVLQLRLG